jgi:hypothetical protein
MSDHHCLTRNGSKGVNEEKTTGRARLLEELGTSCNTILRQNDPRGLRQKEIDRIMEVLIREGRCFYWEKKDKQCFELSTYDNAKFKIGQSLRSKLRDKRNKIKNAKKAEQAQDQAIDNQATSIPLEASTAHSAINSSNKRCRRENGENGGNRQRRRRKGKSTRKGMGNHKYHQGPHPIEVPSSHNVVTESSQVLTNKNGDFESLPADEKNIFIFLMENSPVPTNENNKDPPSNNDNGENDISDSLSISENIMNYLCDDTCNNTEEENDSLEGCEL